MKARGPVATVGVPTGPERGEQKAVGSRHKAGENMTTKQLKIYLETKVKKVDRPDIPFEAIIGQYEIAYHTARLADAQERTNDWLGRIESAIRDTEMKAWLMEIASQLTHISQKP